MKQAAENLENHFEKLYTDIRDRSESDNPVHDQYNPDRPFVLKKNEIRYNDGSYEFTVIKPKVWTNEDEDQDQNQDNDTFLKEVASE